MTNRFVPAALLLVAATSAIGCMNLTSTSDNSGTLYGRIRGTVTRSNGAAVPNVTVGISCVGKDADPFGMTTQTNSTGAFEIAIATPGGFQFLPGLTTVCRVLTPPEGTAQAETSVTVTYSVSSENRPTTQVALVVP